MKLVKASLDAPLALEEFVRELGSSDLGTPVDGDFASGKVGLDDYLKQICAAAVGKGLPHGWVPQTTLWLLNESGHVVGVSRFRDSLTPSLMNRGGHITYYVLSSQRRKGFGEACLALTLNFVRQAEIPKVLVTCASDNTASIRVIETNGGLLENELYDDDGELYRRYWIKLNQD